MIDASATKIVRPRARRTESPCTRLPVVRSNRPRDVLKALVEIACYAGHEGVGVAQGHRGGDRAPRDAAQHRRLGREGWHVPDQARVENGEGMMSSGPHFSLRPCDAMATSSGTSSRASMASALAAATFNA